MHRLELSMSRNLSPCLPKAGPCTTAQIRQDAFWGGESGDECEDAMGRRAMCAALDSSSTLQKQICEISTLWLRSQSVSHYWYRTPSRELMAHTLTLLTRGRVRRVSLPSMHRHDRPARSARPPDRPAHSTLSCLDTIRSSLMCSRQRGSAAVTVGLTDTCRNA